jgi:hypothetical protein
VEDEWTAIASAAITKSKFGYLYNPASGCFLGKNGTTANPGVSTDPEQAVMFYVRSSSTSRGFEYTDQAEIKFISTSTSAAESVTYFTPIEKSTGRFQLHKDGTYIFVDKSGPSKIRASYDKARETLKEGMSLVVFPEGARSFTGHMGVFRRGAFMLADELQLPVVPLTINGSFDVKPRTKDLYWIFWHPLTLTIHKPIKPKGKGPENIKNQMERSYEAVMSGLEPKYQGFVENPDQ